MSARPYDEERRRQEKIAKKEEFMTVGEGADPQVPGKRGKPNKFFEKDENEPASYFDLVKVRRCMLKPVESCVERAWFQHLNLSTINCFQFCFQFQLAPLYEGRDGGADGAHAARAGPDA